MKENSTPQKLSLFKHIMKSPPLIRICAILTIGAACLCAPRSGHAQVAPSPTDSFTNSFDTSSSVASWIYWYGIHQYNYNTPMTWDSTMDAASNVNSGSLL